MHKGWGCAGGSEDAREGRWGAGWGRRGAQQCGRCPAAGRLRSGRRRMGRLSPAGRSRGSAPPLLSMAGRGRTAGSGQLRAAPGAASGAASAKRRRLLLAASRRCRGVPRGPPGSGGGGGRGLGATVALRGLPRRRRGSARLGPAGSGRSERGEPGEGRGRAPCTEAGLAEEAAAGRGSSFLPSPRVWGLCSPLRGCSERGGRWRAGGIPAGVPREDSRWSLISQGICRLSVPRGCAQGGECPPSLSPAGDAGTPPCHTEPGCS